MELEEVESKHVECEGTEKKCCRKKKDNFQKIRN